MSIQLTILDQDQLPVDALDTLLLTLYGDGLPLGHGTITGPGLVQFEADIVGVKQLMVRAETGPSPA